MLTDARKAFNGYTAQIASLNGVDDVTKKFAIAPSIEQTLVDKAREQADFLQEINMPGVRDESGEKLGLDVSGPAASRTDTTTTDRQPRNLLAMDGRAYKCEKTDYDTYIKYSQIDAWSKFPDFQTRLRNLVMQQIARDKLMIGWNGLSVAATTNLSLNPLLQDVNIGWLEHLRQEAPARVVSGVKIGDQAGCDFKTIDAAVFDMAEHMLDEWHKDAPDIKAIVGRHLLADKYLAAIEAAGDKATEIAALRTLNLSQTVGGRPARTVPYFPARSIFITAPKNLAIYWQTGSFRRQIKDNSARDRIEDFLSIKEAFVIEDLGKACLMEGIQIPDGNGGWA